MDEAEENVPEPEEEKSDEDFKGESDVASGEDDASRGGSGGYDRPCKGERSDGLAAEPRDDGCEERASTKASPTASEQDSSPSQEGPSDSSSAKILTMDTDEEPKESPTRTKKYSPEVEAALDRLNSEDAAVDLNTEPLSTEPKKKSHAGHIFLFILFVLAIAAVALCVLVEQKIIDNPFPDLFKKQETSETAPAETKTNSNTNSNSNSSTSNKTESKTEPTDTEKSDTEDLLNSNTSTETSPNTNPNTTPNTTEN